MLQSIAQPSALALALLLVSTGCDGGGSDAMFAPRSETVEVECTEPSDGLPENNIFRVEGLFEDVDHWDCDRPTASTGAFLVDAVRGTEATVTGSSATIELDWSGPEEISGHNLLFWLANGGDTIIRNGQVTHSGGGRGYYRYVIPDNSNPMHLEFFVDPEAFGGDYQMHFAIDDTVGDPLEPRVGTIARQPLWVIEVGSGDIQINLNWNTLVDLDLHVTDPTGFEIYYGDLESPSGGMLDLDSYPACNFDGDRGRGNENVFWPIDEAPSGQYRVEANMWSDCGTYAAGVPTLYRATIVHGAEIQVVEGRFDPVRADGTTAIPSQTHEVATFTF